MKPNKDLNFTTAAHRINDLKKAVRSYVNEGGSSIILSDYHISYASLLKESQRETFAESLETLEKSSSYVIDAAARTIALFDDGNSPETLQSLETLDLRAENHLLQLELLELKMGNTDTETIDTKTDTSEWTHHSELTQGVDDINALFAEKAEGDSIRLKLENLIDERTNELKNANKELESMNKELASFAYISSHDLQEPLRKIHTFGSIIMANEFANLSESGKRNFIRMQQAAGRMTKLIQDLLTYSRSNATEKTFEQIDLNLILREVASDFADSINDKDGVLSIGPMPTINAIPFQIRQLFNNLISNALKFSKETVAPLITILSETVSGNTIENPNAIHGKDYLHVSVSDNGIGFSPQYASRIFEVFQRLHGKGEYEGTGIGLAICMKIAENHKAILNASSQPNEGAVFNVYFPLN